jgi:signal transduction histidine kinase
MKSSLSLVISGETGPVTGDQEHFLGMTMRNIDRLDRLVGDLLDVSRADAGHLNLRPSLLDVAGAVRDGVDSHRQAALRAGLALELRGASTAVMVRLDGDKLQQILDNLVGNAIKYTPSGGRVEVSLDVFPEEDFLRLEVRDNGPGMDPETRERVLQPFQRSEAATRSLVPGTGLGLHITKRLAEAQGGRLGLTSGVGRGTSVRVELPLGRTGETIQTGLRAEPVEI